jgi:hypothetical protein
MKIMKLILASGYNDVKNQGLDWVAKMLNLSCHSTGATDVPSLPYSGPVKFTSKIYSGEDFQGILQAK